MCEKLPAVHGNIITNVGGQKDGKQLAIRSALKYNYNLSFVLQKQFCCLIDAIDRHTELMNQVKDFYKTAINGLKRKITLYHLSYIINAVS